MSDSVAGILRPSMSHPNGEIGSQGHNESFPRFPLSSSPPTSSGSPLQLFVQAKKAINGLYAEVGDYVNGAARFLNVAASGSGGAVTDEDSAKVSDYQRKVEGIREVLQRDHMKVVFFGRTSNGKSTAINALLGDKILPTGIGHTTSCFLQVEGSTDAASPAYLLTEGSDERKPVESISQLANALCDEKLDSDAKIRIVWPKARCKMLAEEVVIIDSPGIDVESDLDEWIDKFCLDSDVFVLVANSESTLMLTEKKFFHKVNEKLSNPNIFVVHNRSDAFAGEERAHEVKQQHMERAVKFLVDELAVCANKSEAEDRIFFISAKEALQARLQEAKGLPPQISTEDFFPRYLEFQNFEKKFAHCLSNSAVQTKFAQHTSRGVLIVKEVSAQMGAVNATALKAHEMQDHARKELRERCDYTEDQLEQMTLEMKDKIHQITEDVEYKVGKAMSEEIRRLSVLVDEFNDPFHPDPLVLNVYKSKLNHHIESGVGSNLRSRLSSDLQLNMESHQQVMVERMLALLPSDRQTVSKSFLPRRDSFEVLYHLHCDNLCSDFQEDLQFRFSLGLAAVIQRFMGAGTQMRAKQQSSRSLQSPTDLAPGGNNLPVPRGLSTHSPVTPTNEFFVPQDDWSLVSKIALASLTSHGTMGGLIVGGLLLKTVGWRFIMATGAVYSAAYAYERLTWTTQAKCREFKRQYVDHAARKLRLIVDMTSANCSHQVQQELSSTFARLCHLVDETTSDMKEDMRRVDQVLKDLDETVSKSKVLKNEASFLTNKLELFEQTYLSELDRNGD